MAENAELVFFDTFSHENSEEINLDLVQFPNIIYISEVRIIPLGARVQADFPGGVRLGATNPSQFEIEFFVNDLEKPGACTFESLGGFEYKQNGSIHLECKRKVPTDGLVLRGWYTTITLAVYGISREAMQEQAPSSNAHSHLALPIASEAHPPPEAVAASAATQEWVQQHAQVAEADRGYMVDTSHSGDPYNGVYQGDQHQGPPHGPASGDYSNIQSGHNYHEEWNQQSAHAPPSTRQPVLIPGGGSGPSEGYEAPKDAPRSYDQEPLPWENSSTRSDDKLPWERGRDRAKDRDRERDRDRDRERDRHRESDRDRDRDRDRHRDVDRDRDRSRERLRDRGRHRDRDVYSRERSRDRSRDETPERDWDERRRDDRRERDRRDRDRSNSGSRERERDYSSRPVSRERDRDRDSDWDGKRRTGDWPGRRDRDRDHDRDHNRSSNSWGDRSPEDHHRPPLAPHLTRDHRDRERDRERDRDRERKPRDGSWERERERDRERDRDRDRDRDRGFHHGGGGGGGGDWDDRDDAPPPPPPSRKRPRTPPNPPQHLPHKRPHTPHTPPEEKPVHSPPPPPPPPPSQHKKDEGSSSPHQFDSLSPGDVESISEGEIPEADPDADVDAEAEAASVGGASPPVVENVAESDVASTNSSGQIQSSSVALNQTETVENSSADIMRPLSVDPMIDDSREREAAVNLALLAAGGDDPAALAAVAAAAVAAVTSARAPLLSTPSPLASPAASVSSSTSATRASINTSSVLSPAKGTPTHTPPPHPPHPATPPVLSAVGAPTAADSPLNHDETSLDGEQFEPILSDEDMEDDGHFQEIDEWVEESEDFCKSFNPFNCELQPLVHLNDPSVASSEAEYRRLVKVIKEQRAPVKRAIPNETRRLEDLVLGFEDIESKPEIKESWVDATEQVSSLLVPGLAHSQRRQALLERLVSWVKVGLNFELALKQPQPGYKIRHIKAGVRLVEAMCMCGEGVIDFLLASEPVHEYLLRLYRQECMALSIRLMILRALDASLRCQSAVKKFLQMRTSLPVSNGFCLADPVKENAKDVLMDIDVDFKEENRTFNGYQVLLLLFKGNQLSRTKFAITSLLRKLHFYELLDKLKGSVKLIADGNKIHSASDVESKQQLGNESDGKVPAEIVDNIESADQAVVDTIVSCLTEIITVYRLAPLLLAQPKRFLPAHAQFDVGMCSQDRQRPYPALFAFLRTHSFLECCLVLLTSPQTVNCGQIVGLIHDILWMLIDSQDGLQYLAANSEVTNILLRILLQQCATEEVIDESTISPPSAQYLGLCLAYRLQAVHYIDQILEAMHNGDPDPECQDIFESLLGLYCLGFTTVGKLSVVHVLSCGDFISILLSLYKYGSPDTSAKYKKYPGKNFVIDLIVNTVKLSDNGSFLQQFGRRILDSAINSNCRLQDLVPWLKLLETPSLFSFEDIAPLCEIVKRNIEHVNSFPGELISALRVLKHLAVPPRGLQFEVDANSNTENSYCELKYKCVVLELYALDGVTHLTSMLSRLCEAYEQPALHSTNFLGMRGANLVSLVLPTLELLRQMLTLVIQCRNTEFRDLTAISALLQTYTLLNAFPNNALAIEGAQSCCKEVIDILLAYTQPVQTESLSETEGLNKSLWTLMVAEVIRYTTTNAYTFTPGLLMFSELLPLPLPVQTRVQLPKSEVVCTMNSRKLWCAHLHSLSSAVSELISTVCGSSCPSLLHLLRRVCMQLSDLAAPTALVVARSILDSVLASLNVLTKNQSNLQNPPPPAIEGPCSSHTARLLNFLACLITHASVKTAVLHLICAGGRGSGLKSDERFPQFVHHLCRILRTSYSNPAHVQAQECVVSVIQSLCDIEISLVPPPSAESSLSAQQFLACALPPREILPALCGVLLDHISNSQHSFTTILPAVRTILMLAEHDYSFFHLKSSLEKKTDALWNLFLKLCSAFSKDSSDLLSTLSTSMEFLRLCITSDGEDTDRSVKTTESSANVLSEMSVKEEAEEVENSNLNERNGKESSEASVNESSSDLLKEHVQIKEEPMEENMKECKDLINCSKKAEQCNDQGELLTKSESLVSSHIVNNHHHSHVNSLNFKINHHQHVDEDASNSQGLPPRRMAMSISELAWVLGWHKADLAGSASAAESQPEAGESLRKKHPIVSLEKVLQACCVEEESLESLHENVAGLIKLLEDEGSKSPEFKAGDSTEVILPPPEPLLSQFGARPVFSICEPDDDRLSQTYWLAIPAIDDPDQEIEQVKCDILDLAREYIPDLHLLSESIRLSRLRGGVGDEDDLDRVDADGMKKRLGGDDIKYLSTDVKTRRPFVTPMRGRGFTRPVPQRGDLFRSRPPNTSRPPSLHVDDFVALETCGAQPTGPTGYNKMSMRAAKDMMATRSRGRGRGGRFFGSAQQYRREGGAGGNLRVSNNLRGDVSTGWANHDGQGQASGGPQRAFRTPDQPRDMRMMRSEEKLGSSVGGPGRLNNAGLRSGGLGGWPNSGKEGGRERFGGGLGRGNRRDGRHQRAFR